MLHVQNVFGSGQTSDGFCLWAENVLKPVWGMAKSGSRALRSVTYLCKCGACLTEAVHPAIDASEEVVGLSPAWRHETTQKSTMKLRRWLNNRCGINAWVLHVRFGWRLDAVAREDESSPRLEM